jgi:hypothetical protein
VATAGFAYKDLKLEGSIFTGKEPEALEPGVNQHRTTASVIWSKSAGEGRNFTASFVWGRLKPSASGSQDSFLAEADYGIGKYSVFGRAELVEKTGEELGIEAFGHDILNVGALSIGAARKILERNKFVLSFGAMGTINFMEDELEGFYGDAPFSVEIFFRLSPPEVKTAHMGHAM